MLKVRSGGSQIDKQVKKIIILLIEIVFLEVSVIS